MPTSKHRRHGRNRPRHLHTAPPAARRPPRPGDVTTALGDDGLEYTLVWSRSYATDDPATDTWDWRIEYSPETCLASFGEHAFEEAEDGYLTDFLGPDARIGPSAADLLRRVAAVCECDASVEVGFCCRCYAPDPEMEISHHEGCPAAAAFGQPTYEYEPDTGPPTWRPGHPELWVAPGAEPVEPGSDLYALFGPWDGLPPAYGPPEPVWDPGWSEEQEAAHRAETVATLRRLAGAG